MSFTHLIGWAIVTAASEQRSMSHYFTDADGQPFRVDPGAINLGLAVDVERRDGSRFLVVPVIKGADGMDFAAFHARYEELVEAARGGKLGVDDMTGATITLTNPGTLGTAASVPRLMPNQGTIVATGTIRSVGADRRMTITSTYDHRIIQGAESGALPPPGRGAPERRGRLLRRCLRVSRRAGRRRHGRRASAGAGRGRGRATTARRPMARPTSSSRPSPPAWRS